MWEHPCGFDIWGAGVVFSVDDYHLFAQCVLAIIPPDKGCDWGCGDQTPCWILSRKRASSLLCGFTAQSGAGSAP